VEEDCSVDMTAVVRVWLLLLLVGVMMTMAGTVPVDGVGNSGLR
jgi:hypothetical protein